MFPQQKLNNGATVRTNSKQTKTVDENKPVDDSEKSRAYRKKNT